MISIISLAELIPTTLGNGRLYDPITARMMNADPIIANPNSAQDYNRYSYVRNNPLKYQDPTGFMGVGMQRTYHYRIMDFAAINGKLATDSHDAILQMKMMGHKGVESQYLEALLWAEQSEGGDGSGSPEGDDDLLEKIATWLASGGIYGAVAYSISLAVNLPTGGYTPIIVLYIVDGPDKGVHYLYDVAIGAQVDLSSEITFSAWISSIESKNIRLTDFTGDRLKLQGGVMFISAAVSIATMKSGHVMLCFERSITLNWLNTIVTGGFNWGETYLY